MPPPQLGTFSLSTSSSHQSRFLAEPSSTSRSNSSTYMPRQHVASSMEASKRDKKRKELAGKLGKEMSDRRDDFFSGRTYSEAISSFAYNASQLSYRPELHPMYNLRLYPVSIERSALLAQNQGEERYGLENAQTAYEEERERVEEEWKKGREKIRERMLEGIEERRRRAREEKEGEGTAADATIDLQSRPHVTRKLRNKVGTTSSPPPPLASLPQEPTTTGIQLTAATASFTLSTNPLSLSIDELPSPFSLPLTSSSLPASTTSASHLQFASGATSGAGSGGSRRRGNKNGGTAGADRMVGGLGKSLSGLTGAKDYEIEGDLGEIRKCNKRRRAAATAASGAIAGSAVVGATA